MHFGSCAKSTISVDSDLCEKESCIQIRKQWNSLCESMSAHQNTLLSRQQLMHELDRQQRKITILEKSKELLSQQICLVKEELQNKVKMIKKMQKVKLIEKETKNTWEESNYTPNLSIIIQEKEQQIELISQSLKSRDKLISSLQFEKSQMSSQIQSKTNIIQKLQESTRSQLQFYQKQVKHLEETIHLKNIEASKIQQGCKEKIQKEQEKYQLQINNLNKKVSKLEKEVKMKEQQLQSINTRYEKMTLSKQSTQNLLLDEKQKVEWLNKLIEEAKINYIHQQLKKQEKRDKIAKEKVRKCKNTSFLSNECKSFRSVSEASTALTSAKIFKQPNNNHSISPFQLSPIHREISQDLSQISSNHLNQ